MGSDEQHNLHWIWKETNNRLDTLSARVQENRCVDEACDFARWLLGSGIVGLLERGACDGFHKVDGANIRWKADELQRACQERYRRNDSKPHIEALQLQSIHEKLNLMAGYLSKLTVGGAQVHAAPELQIISGGLDSQVNGYVVNQEKKDSLCS